MSCNELYAECQRILGNRNPLKCIKIHLQLKITPDVNELILFVSVILDLLLLYDPSNNDAR